MFSVIHTATLCGIDAIPVDVEVDVSQSGLPYTSFVGLATKEVLESKERVRSAIRHSGIRIRAKKTIINLSPANIPKRTPSFDLPIAIGILVANEFLKFNNDVYDSQTLFLGELSLDGSLHYVRGALASIHLAEKLHYRYIILPKANAHEVFSQHKVIVLFAETLRQVMDYIEGHTPLQAAKQAPMLSCEASGVLPLPENLPYIFGQKAAKRAILVAAAGGHHILLYGSPGRGKTLLAQLLYLLLPPLFSEELEEVVHLYSTFGITQSSFILQTQRRPFREPSHTISQTKLFGSYLGEPGEIIQAHRGILFLDEFLEHAQTTLNTLRQPLETGVLTLSHPTGQLRYPASFSLIAATNPCPCGYQYSNSHHCSCAASMILRYKKRCSAPLKERIDLFCPVEDDNTTMLSSPKKHEYIQEIEHMRTTVCGTRLLQYTQLKKHRIYTNAQLRNELLYSYCVLTRDASTLLQHAEQEFHLAPRRVHIIMRVAKTIADIDRQQHIEKHHIAEAIGLCTCTL